MIVDSSAVIAVLLQEEEHEPVLEKLIGSSLIGIGAPTLAETALVLTAKRARNAQGTLKRFLEEFGIETISFSDQHWPVALEAYERFGKGRHRAALNFGDCLTYAVAKVSREPLLCVGDDFARTDLSLA